ncbi:MAG TPA: single-stranded DNA-binding protein [Blastocatellia bacterium]|nr:single-stranded DNA-binding protein [Blastocatellia bacterium]
MSSFNKITIVGHLGRDPETHYTPHGTAVCSFSVATTERRKDKGGEITEQTTWFRVSCFGRQAEIAQQRLAKGRQVYLEGRLRLEEFTDREGRQRSSLEVTAGDLQFIGGRSGETSTDELPFDRGAAKRVLNHPATAVQASLISEDDIPF